MLKKIGLAVILCLTSWSSAQACTYAFQPNAAYDYSGLELTYVNTEGYVSPKAIKPLMRSYMPKSDFEDIIDDSSSIFIAEVKRKPLKSIGGTDRKYDRFIFNVKNTLKGEKYKQVEYSDSKGRIVPGLSKKEYNEELSRNYEQLLVDVEKQQNSHKELQFWDNPQFFKNEMSDEIMRGTSCGAQPTPVLVETQLYIVIANGATFSERFIVEPISGLDDPFYKYVIERIANPFERTGPQMTYKQFLHEMDFLKVVEIKSCSSDLIKNASEDEWNPYLKDTLSFSPQQIFDRNIRFEINESRKEPTSPEFLKQLEVNYPSLFEYFGLEKSKVSCKAGEQFLVYGLYPDEELPLFETCGTPIYRYARVENSEIETDDIKTNISLIGEETLSISDLFEK